MNDRQTLLKRAWKRGADLGYVLDRVGKRILDIKEDWSVPYPAPQRDRHLLRWSLFCITSTRERIALQIEGNTSRIRSIQ